MTEGPSYVGPHDDKSCATCLIKNSKKAKFGKSNTFKRSTIRGGRIHSDVKEVPTSSFGGHKHAVCFIDDMSRRSTTYPLRKKSEVLDKFILFVEECAIEGIEVKCLRSDTGGEYIAEEMQAFCRSREIRQEFSPPHCQSANGVSEVYWRETFKMVRTIIYDQQRSDSYWVAALQFANTIRNNLVTDGMCDMWKGHPPESVWKNEVVNTAMFRVPLTTCYSHIEKGLRATDDHVETLADRRMQGVFVGYDLRSSAYLVYDPVAKHTYTRRYADVKFPDESSKAPQDTEPTVLFVETILAKMDLELMKNAELAEAKTLKDGKAMFTPLKATSPSQQVVFVRIAEDQSVRKLAAKFSTGPNQYLKLLHEYEGWYQGLGIEDTIEAGSDIPVNMYKVKKSTNGKKRRGQERPNRPLQIKGVTIEGVTRSQKSDIAMRTRSRDKALFAHGRHMTELNDLCNKAARAAIREQKGLHISALAMAAVHNDAKPTPRNHEKEPKNYSQARKADSIAGNTDWMTSHKKEWDGLWAKGAFEDQPIGNQKLHYMMWALKVKNCGQKKSRLVFDGRRQDPSTYDAIRSPTMKLTSFRMLLAMAARESWDVYADDATQAFLNAERPADKPLWAMYPEGFRKPGRCLLIKKQLYGLHDAPLGWYLAVRDHMVKDQGFTQSPNDECLFYKKDIYVVVHVDDFASTGSPTAIAAYRKALHFKFAMTGGKISEYYGLGIKVDKQAGNITVSSEDYINRTRKKLKLMFNHEARTVFTPGLPEETLPVLVGECKATKLHHEYRAIVGSIMHAATTARPDVEAVVKALACHLQHPGEQHLKAAYRAFDYLNTTKTWKLTYTNSTSKEYQFYGTSDASHNTEADAKGITGWSFHFAGGCVSWKSHKQSLVALSSTESEIIAVDEATRELRFLNKLRKDFKIGDDKPTPMAQDNMSTLELIRSQHFNPRTRHISLRYHHTGEQQALGVLQSAYCPTDRIPSDLLTKPLARELHHRHAKVLLGMEPIEWEELKGLHAIEGDEANQRRKKQKISNQIDNDVWV